MYVTFSARARPPQRGFLTVAAAASEGVSDVSSTSSKASDTSSDAGSVDGGERSTRAAGMPSSPMPLPATPGGEAKRGRVPPGGYSTWKLN
jgi:hypothetical protein